MLRLFKAAERPILAIQSVFTDSYELTVRMGSLEVKLLEVEGWVDHRFCGEPSTGPADCEDWQGRIARH